MNDFDLDTPIHSETTSTSINKFIDVDNIFEDMGQEEAFDLRNKIYENYAKAMRMRNREPLEASRFEGHFFMGGNYEKSLAFGSPKDGYLLGSDINGIFIPTHFAPSGLREGYRLIKGLVDSDRPTALFITQDLVDTVQKMKGWKVLPFKIKTDFRGEDVEKTLVVNQWATLKKLAAYHIGNIMRGKISEMGWKIREIGDKAKKLILKDKANANDIDEELKDLFSSQIQSPLRFEEDDMSQ